MSVGPLCFSLMFIGTQIKSEIIETNNKPRRIWWILLPPEIHEVVQRFVSEFASW